MKVQAVLFNIFLFNSSSIECSNLHKNYSELGQVFKNIIENLHESNREISIKNFDSDVEIIDSIIPKTSQGIPFKITNLNKSAEEFLINESAVFLFKSVESLIEFNNKTNFTNVSPKSFQLFVHFQEATIEDLSPLKELRRLTVSEFGSNFYFGSEIVHYEYFILETDDCFQLLTFLWYTADKCNEPQLFEINRFQKATRQWNSSKFEIKKFHDFHGCNLTIEVVSPYPAFLFYFAEGSPHYFEILYHILGAISRPINSTFSMTPYRPASNELKRKVDLLVFEGCYNYHDYKEAVYFLAPFQWVLAFLAVPLGAEYDGYEKLVFPFDTYTWTLIIIIFVLAYTVIMIVSFLKSDIRDFIIGRNVRTPALNIAAIFFGLTQTTLPSRTFARFITVTFIIYCLIIRTSWQAKMFGLMQNQIKKPEVKSVDEMIGKNFTFYMEPLFPTFYSESDIILR